jgi:hypothetical protein
MTLVEAIAEWQHEALSIHPPSGTDLLPAVGIFQDQHFSLMDQDSATRSRPITADAP